MFYLHLCSYAWYISCTTKAWRGTGSPKTTYHVQIMVSTFMHFDALTKHSSMNLEKHVVLLFNLIHEFDRFKI